MKEETRGRKLKFKTVKKLQDAIDEYFSFCDNRISHFYSAKAEGVVDVLDPAPYTMSGLARRMGIDRRTLLDYSKRDLFLPAIKEAREKVHEDVETRLMEKQAVGAIFNLKNNFDWKDRTEVEQSGKIELEAVKKYSDKELDAIIRDKVKANVERRQRELGDGVDGKRSPQGK